MKEAPGFFVPGRNCWRVEHADRIAFLVDAKAYFDAVREALIRARRSIIILGWDIDSQMRLVPGGANDGWPEPLGAFLDALVARHSGLDARILSWDFAVLYAFEREWMPSLKLHWATHPRLHFRLDARHPFGASHHQKVVVIDDAIAFVGGLDLTRSRWDTTEHAEAAPHRVDHDGKAFGPFHDVQIAVDGRAAAALGELARTRWARSFGPQAIPATGVDDPAPPPSVSEPEHDRWPAGLVPDLTDAEVAIARTEPPFDGRSGVDEVACLFADAIGSARAHLYVESQYFTSDAIATAMEKRLRGADAPEMVIVIPERESGWLEQNTMGILRARLHRRLAAADAHGRYRPLVPVLPWCDAERRVGILNLHSKVLIADDDFLTIGSANLSNRSLGFDTECNLAVAAHGDDARARRTRAAIAALRARLLGEHLGVAAARVAETLAATASLVATIAALSPRSPAGQRTLVASDPPLPSELDVAVPDADLLDPARPIDADQMMHAFVPSPAHRPVRFGLVAAALAVLALAALALAWRVTPLSHLLNVQTLVDFGQTASASPLAPLAVVAVYVAGGLIVMPVTLLIAVTGIVFGPVLGALYALAGSVASAAVTYGIGRVLGREKVERYAGPRINRVSARLARSGIVAVAIVRLLPLAPFSIVNVIAGTTQIRLRDFLIGTAIGLMPGIVVTVVFVDRVTAAVRQPGWVTFLLLALVAAAIVGVSLFAKRKLDTKRRVEERHGKEQEHAPEVPSHDADSPGNESSQRRDAV